MQGTPNNTPRISVVIPSFNQRSFLTQAIESVLGQQGAFGLEVWVIDGGSTDGSVALLMQYGDRVRWVSERDEGQSDALNKGFARVTGDIVGWLNSDDLYRPGALGAVADAFSRHPETEWLHGRTDIIDAQGIEHRSWVSLYKDWRCRHYSYRQLLTENFIQPNAVFWRKRLGERVGGVRTDLHLAMDYDLWLRFAKESEPLFLDRSLACFRWYSTSKSGSRYIEQFREARRIAREREPDWRWVHRVGALKATLATGCYLTSDWLQRRGVKGS
jgi:glycosyltransferase involved in cell wall biosynthesis